MTAPIPAGEQSPADHPTTARLLELRALCAGPTGASPEALIMVERRSMLVILDELMELRQVVRPQQPGVENALQAVLVFHHSGYWDAAHCAKWERLTGSTEATTKALCDTVRAAIAAVQAGEGWQPIATAPQDGTRVLVGGPGWTRGTHWHGDGFGFLTDQDPTHWRPMPAPPAGAAP